MGIEKELFELIKSRRSIRKYTDQPVDKEIIDILLEAAIYAPSSKNTQPWHFTVIKNEGLGKPLNQATKEVLLKSDVEILRKLGQREDLFYGAPVIIVVSGRDKYQTSIIDCSAAVENMLLLAEAYNIGTCWNGLVANLFRENPNHPSIQALEIPEGYSPFYAVSLGYYERKQEAPLRKGTPITFLD